MRSRVTLLLMVCFFAAFAAIVAQAQDANNQLLGQDSSISTSDSVASGDQSVPDATTSTDGTATAPVQQESSASSSLPTVVSPTVVSPSSATGSTGSQITGSPTKASNLYCLPGNVPNFGASDGPASMPQACYYTVRSATPSPNGVKWTVSSSSGMTTALAGAACGDIIQINAGSTISGNFTYSKTCSSSKYITIQTSGIKSLPPEGTRVKPCYAGVGSETGYPSFNCTSTTNVMAKLTTANSNPVLTIATGASYLRVIGIEFTRQTGTGLLGNLVESNGNQADHLIFDQVYMHGNQKTDETTRGLSVTGMSYVAVVDSFFSDFWCIAISGGCTDSQAIQGNSSASPMAVVKIVNNFLAAAAENILLGGAGAGAQQHNDVEIRRNWLYKPLTWYPSSSTYDGVSRIEKNEIEFKECNRCLVEANVLQNAWSGYSQAGAAFLLTPREDGVAPCCYDANVTFRYNYVTHACQVFETGSDPTAQGLHNASIHDSIADDLTYNLTGNYSCFDTYLTQLYSAPNNGGSQVPIKTVMHDFNINHLTIVTSLNNVQGLDVLDGPAVNSPQQVNIVTFMNSIMDAGIYGFHTAVGGSYSCTNGNNSSNSTLINGCWQPNSFDYHVLVRGGTAGGAWPGSHNSLPSTFSSVGFVNYKNGVGGDYRLCTGAGQPSSTCAAGSPYHNAASDGKDIGANVTLVNQYLAGVNTL